MNSAGRARPPIPDIGRRAKTPCQTPGVAVTLTDNEVEYTVTSPLGSKKGVRFKVAGP